ncbi:Serine/threonine-protein phosphatase 7 long form [Glycine max]|nr:Serine/threonine-protein phosphatase 7 long form [Glycine max]
MASSSSCPSNIKIKSGPINGDVLWMQVKHVSEHVWNGEEDRKLHIRGVVPTWLAHHFAQINNHDDEEQVRRFTRAWILRFIGGVLFVNKSSNKVSLRYLQFLRDFRDCNTYAWDLPYLLFYTERCAGILNFNLCTWLRRENQHISNDDVRVFRRKLDIMKRHEFVWEPYTTTVISLLPPICIVGSVAWFAVVPLICFQVIEWHQPDRVLRQFGMQQPIPGSPSQPLNIHGITLKGKHDKNWGQLSAPMIDQWNNRHAFRVDTYPRQEGLLSFNSDYMVWYRRKTKIFVNPQNANTTTLVFICFLNI